MKKFTKVVSLVLSLAMMTALVAGCGNTSNGGNTFKIGGIGPLTGGAAVYGQAVMNGAQIAIDEINAAGGINGYQIEYKFEDDEHDAEKAVNAYNTLLDWKMQILMGNVTSTPCIAVVDKSHADNIFQLTPSATATEAIAQDNAFRVCFSDPNQGKASAQFIGQNNVAKKVAIIYNSQDAYSSGIMTTFTEEAANQGIEIVACEAFTAEAKSDFTTQLQAAVDGGAELVFLPIYCEEASLILTQAAAKEINTIFFGCDGLDGILALDGFDKALAENVMLATPFAATSSDEKVVSFVTEYQKRYESVPNQFAADAYDAIYIIKAAAEKAGAKPSMTNAELCEAMKSAMTQVSFSGITGKDITWDATGEPAKAPMVVKIVDGEYVTVE